MVRLVEWRFTTGRLTRFASLFGSINNAAPMSSGSSRSHVEAVEGRADDDDRGKKGLRYVQVSRDGGWT